MCRCEDRPACGHPAEERADDAYRAERAWWGDDEDAAERDYQEMLNADDTDEASEESNNEDAGLEESLLGDC